MTYKKIITILFFLLIGISIFSSVWFADSLLQVSDVNVGRASVVKDGLPASYFGRWEISSLLGHPSCLPLAWSTLALWGIAPDYYVNYIYFFCLLCGSLFLFFTLVSRKGFSLSAAAIGAVTAFWLGSNLTLLAAGHQGKFGCLLFFAASLFCITNAHKNWRWTLFSGGAIGAMFMEQPDMALFFALFAGAYLIFCLWQTQGFKPLKWLKILIPAAVVAFLFSAGPLLSGYKQHVKGAVQMQSENKQAKWNYVTQWSFPPEEMIAFVAPGYTGWRSGEPEGPYWGRMGRSAGWEQTHQGFRNFKLENTYFGIIPIAFALFALFSCRRSKHRAEILFWGGATVVALLLAFGKFFPLYSLFYKLPVVNNIRNPNKFLQVFQVCLAILTAYGFDALFSRKSKVERQRSEIRDQRTEVKNFFWGSVGVLGVLGIWALSFALNRTDGVAEFVAQGWPQDAAQVIVQNKIVALWHASFMAAVVAAVFALFSFSRFGKWLRFKNWIAAALVLIVAADAVKLSKHYVKEMPRSYIESNALTDFLKKDLGHQRVALLSQQGIYGVWTIYLLPYNKIPTFNFSDMPRMATDYQTFLEAGQRNPLNMWRFSAVKYLLGPAAAEKQLAGQARKVFAYDLASAPNNGFQVIARPTGAHAVFELLSSSPRYAVVAPIERVSDEQALASVAKPPRPQTGSAEVLSYRPGKVKLRVTADVPSTLRVAEKWDADWKAEVDGRSVEVQRVDYICQGVDVPAGEHEIVLRYAPSKLFFYMQCVGYLILLGALVFALIRRRDRCALDQSDENAL